VWPTVGVGFLTASTPRRPLASVTQPWAASPPKPAVKVHLVCGRDQRNNLLEFRPVIGDS
jgi:hypothetical protein